jgi:hypothetical protein
LAGAGFFIWLVISVTSEGCWSAWHAHRRPLSSHAHPITGEIGYSDVEFISKTDQTGANMFKCYWQSSS